jgi:hypothetical protein
VMATLDPFYQTVLYVSPDAVGDVKNFYRDKLPNAKLSQYKDEDEWVWAYLLVPNFPFPDKPTRDDLPLLDATPNVMVKKFQKILHEPLIEYYQTKPESRAILNALQKAKTIIRFTYRIIEEDAGFKQLTGSWVNADRSLAEYYNCRLAFGADSTYTLTLTDSNIAAFAAKLAKTKHYAGKPESEIRSSLTKCNPEKGRYSVLRNTIDMSTGAPVIGDAQKSGLIEIHELMFSVQYINMPRLTFMHDTKK